ncbi:AMP-binding protein [Steroidobacter sp. S1-65]|uniref:AMP-binding protein n=1 Tax=Steroidobacter gossypii TaxID=2805490 RepID=A0ABS1WWM5_9GAMM|nr:AMP-binding protein [Steroidobacter gossypii]MBM0105358.1 AMP-binding protein [Steroidobacter gossypii]
MLAQTLHMPYSSHVDGFARERLPPPHLWPEFRFDLPELQYPERINCGVVLLDDAVREGHGDRVALYSDNGVLTYAQLLERSNRIANVLVKDMGVVPGNRVLLRGPNNPTLVACWLAVMKAGAIAVTTMPLLRAHELSVIAERARVDHALCDSRFAQELEHAAALSGQLNNIVYYEADRGGGRLEKMMNGQASTFDNVDTARDDVCLLAFTSGTTGTPKATMHFHRDVLAMRAVVADHLLETSPEDIYVGSPPLGFTFGLGALLVFPLGRRGASVLVEQPSGENLLSAVQRCRATALFTSPTAYRALLPLVSKFEISSLKRCISAGEALPKATSDAWHAATGIRIIDGIGATELIHIFISAKGEEIRPGTTGKPLPGYQACILDPEGLPLPPGKIGRLAIKGPTGCRYLDDARQRDYVYQGWNITGDLYSRDEAGYYRFEARADDMIISAGYNIAGPEVEAALLEHPAVKECAVVGVPDEARGQIVKAFVVLNDGNEGSAELAQTLKQFVKQNIAPYKYPRVIEFRTALPKTATGKLQRHALRVPPKS